jgi:hypothetical protein
MDAILMVVTLAHELVHLSQVMNKRLEVKEINDLSVWFWDGQPYGTEPYADETVVLPWEADAERQEGNLARQFLNNYVKRLNKK